MNNNKGSGIPIWQEACTIKSYNVDTGGNCRLTSLLDFLQEAAGNHATNLGVGYKTLAKNKLAWVLSRLFINVDRYPSWGESITIETWPSSFDRIFAYRDFAFKDAKEKIIAYGKTAWVIMDIETRKMRQVSQLVENIHHTHDRLDTTEKPSKIVGKMEEVCPCHGDYIVQHSDLDTNEHVNNVKYIQWMLNDYGLDFYKTNMVSYLAINYLAEALPDQALCHAFAKKPNRKDQFIHFLKQFTDDKVICKAIFIWKSRRQ